MGEKLREALIRARSDFHLIALHDNVQAMWRDAKAGRDRVHAALVDVEAATDESDPPCTDCYGTGITVQTERRCACQPASPSVVADEPDAGEVSTGIPDLPAPVVPTIYYSAAAFSRQQMEEYGIAAHEAGKREGREEAAKVAESQRKDDWFEVGSVVVATGKRIATAIRALSQQETK